VSSLLISILHANNTNCSSFGFPSGTLSKDKNELLFSEFGANYNDEPAMFRRGSIILRREVQVEKDFPSIADGTVGDDNAKLPGGGAAVDGADAPQESAADDGASVQASTDAGATAVVGDIGGRRRRPRPPPGSVVKATRKQVVVVHDDLIGDAFWEENVDIFPLED